MLRTIPYAIAICLVALSSGVAAAAPITTLFSTGVDSAGNPLALGAADTHYTVNENAGNLARVVNPPHPLYVPNDANSQWIWQQADGLPGSVTRTFRTTFDLTGFNPNDVRINGFWAVDNNGLDILLNGASTGVSLLGSPFSNFTTLNPLSISSGFIVGVNTLEFVVQDLGPPGAFRAQLSAFSIPEPGTLALFGLGLLGAVFARRRYRAAQALSPG